MPPTKNKKRAKTPSAMDRRGKKKVSILTLEKIEYVDWKDVNLLRRFVSDRAKIRARRVTGNSAQQQRDVAMAIKNAREMALLPYTSKVTTQRGGRGGDRRQRDDDRRPREPREPREPRAPEAQKKPSPPKPETEQQEQVIDIPEVAAEVTQETTTEETTE